MPNTDEDAVEKRWTATGELAGKLAKERGFFFRLVRVGTVSRFPPQLQQTAPLPGYGTRPEEQLRLCVPLSSSENKPFCCWWAGEAHRASAAAASQKTAEEEEGAATKSLPCFFPQFSSSGTRGRGTGRQTDCSFHLKLGEIRPLLRNLSCFFLRSYTVWKWKLREILVSSDFSPPLFLVYERYIQWLLLNEQAACCRHSLSSSKPVDCSSSGGSHRLVSYNSKIRESCGNATVLKPRRNWLNYCTVVTATSSVSPWQPNFTIFHLYTSESKS